MPLDHSLIQNETFAARRQAAAAEATKRGLQGLLVWGRGGETGESVNDVLFYANHFSAYCGQPPEAGYLTAVEHAGVVIDASGRGVLVVTGFVSEDAQVDEVRHSYDLESLLGATLRDLHMDTGAIGLIGSEAFPYPVGSRLRHDLPGLRLEPADDIALRQRMRPTDIDLKMLQNAADVGTAIVSAIAKAAAPGVMEGEAVGAGLAEAARTPGCIHWAFMIASGPDAHMFVRSGTPAWSPRYVYRTGDILHIDAYGFVFGYMYDLMRTVVVGDATAEQERTVVAARDLVASVAGLLQGDVTPRQIRAGGLRLAKQAGFDPSGNSTFGHGINLGWGPPWLQEPIDRPDADVPIRPPYAFSFETFLHDGAGNYSAWEDMYVWLPEGVRRMTGSGSPSDLRAPLWPF